MTNTVTTRRQIDEWIKHPLIRVVLQWMAANRSDLREVDAKFQAALAATPREIPDDFRRWAAGRKNVFYEESPPAFHSGGPAYRGCAGAVQRHRWRHRQGRA
jgi:hypothetical protein